MLLNIIKQDDQNEVAQEIQELIDLENQVGIIFVSPKGIHKQLTPQEAQTRGWEPQSGDWNMPYRWVKGEVQQDNIQNPQEYNDFSDKDYMSDDDLLNSRKIEEAFGNYEDYYDEHDPLVQEGYNYYMKNKLAGAPDLSPEQYYLLQLYQSDSELLNEYTYLRRERLGPSDKNKSWVSNMVKTLDKIMQKGVTSKKVMVLYRSIPKGDAEETLLEAYNDSSKHGMNYVNAPFMSTTTDYSVAEEFAVNNMGPIVKVVIPPNTLKVLEMYKMPLSADLEYEEEMEVLLPRNVEFDISQDDDGDYVLTATGIKKYDSEEQIQKQLTPGDARARGWEPKSGDWNRPYRWTRPKHNWENQIKSVINSNYQLKNVLHVLSKYGSPYLVGGCVRDIILNEPSKDYDIEVYGVPIEKLSDIMVDDLGAKGEQVGKQFGIFKVGDFDISLPRQEVKTGDKHTDFDIISNENLPLKIAAQRRDFTINALMYDYKNGHIRDFFGGLEDLENNVIRHIDDKTFIEDALRVYRAAQFAGRFGFKINPKTVKLALTMDLSHLPPERVNEEFKKLLLKSPRPSVGIQALDDMGVVKKYYPEIDDLKATEQRPDYHAEGDVYVHTKMVIDEAAKIIGEWPDNEDKSIIMFAALAHDFGKPSTTQMSDKGFPVQPGHEEAGVEPTINFLSKITNEKRLTDLVSWIVGNHLMPAQLHRATTNDSTFKRIINKHTVAKLKLLAAVARADMKGRFHRFEDGTVVAPEANEVDWFLERIDSVLQKTGQTSEGRIVPLVSGSDLIELGHKEGPYLGKILRDVKEKYEQGDLETKEQALKYVDDNYNIVKSLYKSTGLMDMDYIIDFDSNCDDENDFIMSEVSTLQSLISVGEGSIFDEYMFSFDDDENLQAFCRLDNDLIDRTMTVNSLVTIPQNENIGQTTRLLLDVIGLFISQDDSRQLHIQPFNDDSTLYYENFGFKRDGDHHTINLDDALEIYNSILNEFGVSKNMVDNDENDIENILGDDVALSEYDEDYEARQLDKLEEHSLLQKILLLEKRLGHIGTLAGQSLDKAIEKQLMPTSIEKAIQMGMEPQSGNWQYPVRWIRKQLSGSAPFNTGQVAWGAGQSTILPLKTGYVSDSDRIRILAEEGKLNHFIQEGMTDEEWTQKKEEAIRKLEEAKRILSEIKYMQKAVGEKADMLYDDEDEYLQKQLTPQDAYSRDLEPLPGRTWEHPGHWVSADVEQENFGSEENTYETLDVSQYQQVGPRKGSNPGGLFQAPDGNQYYIKYPETPEHVKNEVVAGELYRLAGAIVPDLYVSDNKGKMGVASHIIPNLNRIDDGETPGVADNFVTDAWLANWDVVGLEYDNMLQDSNGEAVRLDTGGALLYRAMGSPKGGAFGNEVTEIDTLRNPNINRQSADIFGDVTDEQIQEGVKRIAAIPDEDIKRTVEKYFGNEGDDLVNTLIARKNNLSRRFSNGGVIKMIQKQIILPEEALTCKICGSDCDCVVQLGCSCEHDCMCPSIQSCGELNVDNDIVVGTKLFLV